MIIKNCPYCAGDVLLICKPNTLKFLTNRRRIECVDCGFAGPVVKVDSDGVTFTDELRLISSWNQMEAHDAQTK